MLAASSDLIPLPRGTGATSGIRASPREMSASVAHQPQLLNTSTGSQHAGQPSQQQYGVHQPSAVLPAQQSIIGMQQSFNAASQHQPREHVGQSAQLHTSPQPPPGPQA